MAKDPRYKSGEHHYGEPDEDSTKEQLEQLSTIGAVGAEIRSVRREMKLQFRHFGARFDEALNSIREVTAGNQAVSQENATNLVRIRGLEKRVEIIENEDRKENAVESADGWMKTLAKNKTLPWVVAALLALAMVLAAITGRRVDGLVPHHATDPAEIPAAPAVNVNVKG